MPAYYDLESGTCTGDAAACGRTITAQQNDIENQELLSENQAGWGLPSLRAQAQGWKQPSQAAASLAVHAQQEQAADQQQEQQTAYETSQQTATSGGCGFMGLSCAANWAGSEVTAHWRGITQIIAGVGLAVCVVASAGACMVIGAVTALASYGAQGYATHDFSGTPLAELGLNLAMVGAAGALGRSLAGSSEAFWGQTPFSAPVSRLWSYLPMHGDNGLNPGWVAQQMIANLAHDIPGVCTLPGDYEC